MNASGLNLLRWVAVVPLTYGTGHFIHGALLRLVSNALERHFTIGLAISLQAAAAAVEAAAMVLVAMVVVPSHKVLAGRCLLAFFGLSMALPLVLFAGSLYPPYLLLLASAGSALLGAYGAYGLVKRLLAVPLNNLQTAD